ncbi:MAG: hypothetical protein WDO74_22510 [Pseudomonadota bacterium]
MTLLRYALVPLVFSFWACSSDSNKPNDHTEAVLVGPAGGTLLTDGLKIVIPPGALDHEVRITAAAGGTLPPSYTALSRLYTFGPDGTAFLKPVSVSFDLAEAGLAPTVYWSTASGAFSDAHGVVDGMKISATVTHFSQGFVAETLIAGGGSGGSAGSSETGDGGDAGGSPVEPSSGAGAGGSPVMPNGGAGAGGSPVVPNGGAGAGGVGFGGAGAGGAHAGAGGTSAGAGGAGAGGTSAGAGGTSAGAGGAGAGGAGSGGAGAGGTSSGTGGASGAGAGTAVTFTVRDNVGSASNMTWAAWQDGTGAWQALAPSSTGSYSFDPAADHFGVAFMCASADNANSQGSIIYGTSAKRSYDITAQLQCAPVTYPASNTFAATLSNAPTGTTMYLMGSEHASMSSSNTTLTDYNIPHGTTWDFMVGAGSASAVLRASFLRGVVFNDNVTRDVDLAASGFDVGTQTLDVAQAISTTRASVYYAMVPNATLGLGLLRASTFSAGTSHISGSFASVPSVNQASGDTYLVDLMDSSATASRRVLRRFHSAMNVSATMPPDMVATITIGATTPYLRPHYELTQRAGATTYTGGWTYSPSKGVVHTFGVQIEPPYLSGSGQATLDFPDFSGVTGWNAAWGAPSAAAAGALGAQIGVTVITDAAGVHEEAMAEKSVALP